MTPWEWWLQKCAEHQQIFLLLTGTLLLVQPPMMWALSLRLTEDRRNHHEDLLQCFHALSETPVSQYMLETMLRGLHGDVLKHAIGAAVLSSSLATIMPVYNYRTAFLELMQPFWDKSAELALPYLGDSATSLIFGISRQMLMVKLSPILNSVCACLAGGSCIQYALSRSPERTWFVYTLSFSGFLYQWHPVLRNWLCKRRCKQQSEPEEIDLFVEGNSPENRTLKLGI